MWFSIQTKHVFFRNPQRKQNQSPAATQTTSEVELPDYTLISVHILPKKGKKKHHTDIPLMQNFITVCLPSLATYCRMEMMSDFAIAAICHMRSITPECRTYLCF